jgi:hypothetical protein
LILASSSVKLPLTEKLVQSIPQKKTELEFRLGLLHINNPQKFISMKKPTVKLMFLITLLIKITQTTAQEVQYPDGASEPCVPNATAWVLGGNNVMVSTCGRCPAPYSDAGTCNNVPFILKANNFQSVFIQPNGNIGINNPLPVGALDVRSANPVNQGSIRIFGDAMGTVESIGHFNMGFATGHDFNINEGANAIFSIKNGNVGINELGPNEKLEVNGNVRITGNLGVGAYPALEKLHVTAGNARFDGHVGIGGPSTAENLRILDPTNAHLKVATSSNNSPATISIENLTSGYKFYMDGSANYIGHIGSGSTDLINFQKSPGVFPAFPQVWIGGKPTTGTHANDFLFAVNGKMVARAIYVTESCNWADYVFDPNYELPKLEDVEVFYKANKHLPEVPTAKDVEENGIDVAQMNTLLLKKIEELTIYLVEQQKEITRIKKEIPKHQD